MNTPIADQMAAHIAAGRPVSLIAWFRPADEMPDDMLTVLVVNSAGWVETAFWDSENSQWVDACTGRDLDLAPPQFWGLYPDEPEETDIP